MKDSTKSTNELFENQIESKLMYSVFSNSFELFNFIYCNNSVVLPIPLAPFIPINLVFQLISWMILLVK